MINIQQLRQSFFISLWFMVLTFPIMVIRVNTVENVIEWRWRNLLIVGIGSFFGSLVWRYLLRRKEMGARVAETTPAEREKPSPLRRLASDSRFRVSALAVLTVAAVVFPFVVSIYQVNILITALMYVTLGLGLNIVVGLSGLLHLGYAAFYAVGAYTYALLYVHYGIGFWTALPLGMILAALFGILLGFPVLRLRGDYLAIVTLGFGEIIRLVLENWNEFSFGPSGIANIPGRVFSA